MTGPIFLLWLLSIGVSFLLGLCLTTLFWPSTVSRHLKWVFAPAIGLGISSLVFFVFRRPLFTVETALLVTGIVLLLRKRSAGVGLSWRPTALALMLTCALGFAVSAMSVRIERTPHGDWDSWAIWSNHARFLYRDGPLWEEHIANSFHPDYPLLVPASTARAWRYIGEEVPDAGGMMGMAFALTGVAVLAGVLWELRSATLAAVMALTLLTTPFYLEYGVSRSADVPLGLYFLCTAAFILVHFRRAPDAMGLLVLAGLSAGFAGWTKNEGLLFILVVSVVLLSPIFVAPRESVRRFASFIAGLVVPLAVIAFFKLTIAPPNDLTSQRSVQELVAKLLDPSRYAIIIETFSATFWSFGDWLLHPVIPLLVLVGIWGIDRRSVRSLEWITAAGIFGVMLAGYFAVYVLTPADLQWHLGSSLPRLFLQLWPLFLLVIGLMPHGEEDRI